MVAGARAMMRYSQRAGGTGTGTGAGGVTAASGKVAPAGVSARAAPASRGWGSGIFGGNSNQQTVSEAVESRPADVT